MATWRYAAHVKSATPPGAEQVTPGEKTTLWDFGLKSEQEGIDGLAAFLESRKKMFGDGLQWVALERTDADTSYEDTAVEWVEVKRIAL